MLKRVNPMVYITLAVVVIVLGALIYPGPRPIFYPAALAVCFVVLSIPLAGIAARRNGADLFLYASLAVFVSGVALGLLAIVRFLGNL
jgi:hypothetical protein